jgi:RNA polymerase sigma-70 factor (ECF subfamily)
MNDYDLIDLRNRVERYTFKRTRDSQAAEDIAQDVMLKLHANERSLPIELHRRTAWALRVARNAIVDRARTTRPFQALDRGDAPHASDGKDGSRALAGCLSGMIKHLPEEYARAVELADMQGQPQQRVADEMGLSLSGAKSRVQRGRQQLRAMLSECCHVELARDGSISAFEPTPRAARFCGGSKPEKSCVH